MNRHELNAAMDTLTRRKARVYIAGPMTGYVDHNFPAFRAAADHLRGKGYEVVNPAEMDDPNATHEELAEVPHWWYMRRDIKALVECDLIYLLPGWRWSKGATGEADVATLCGIDRLIESDTELWRTFEGDPIPEEPAATPEPPALTVAVEPHFGGFSVADVAEGVNRLREAGVSLSSLVAKNAIDRSIDEHHRKHV